MAFGVCAIKFSDGVSCVGDVGVDDIGCAVGTAGSVVYEIDAFDGSNALE